MTRQAPLIACLLLALPAFAQSTLLPVPEDSAAIITIAPDRAGWTYPVGSPASLRVRVKLTPYPAGGVPVRYRL